MKSIAPHVRRPLCVSLAAVACLACATSGEAQPPAGANGNMPFNNVYRRPTLSPYTSLGFQGNNPMTGDTLGALQGLVRQQQQVQVQQQMGLQQTRQISQLQGQVRNIQRVEPNRESTIRPTGHASTFQNLSHFYPSR